MTARVVVLSKPGCHLCDDVIAVVRRVAEEMRVSWETQDIADDAALMSQWGEYVPVVIVDGEVHTWFRVDETRLRSALSA